MFIERHRKCKDLGVRKMKMLLHPTQLLVLVIIAFLVCQVSETSKPVISPNKEEIVINEGEPLTIACTSLSPIKFIYPNTLKGVQINKTYSIVNKENGAYKLTFHYLNTVSDDTNWYGCVDVDVEITNFYGEPENITNFYDYPELQLIYDNPGVQWIYVYVKSTTKFFVHEDEEENYNLIVDFVYANVGDTKAIPCRPTSPDLVPILRILIKGEYENKDFEKETLFDPRNGFTIRNLTESDEGDYQCLIQKNDVEHYFYVKLFVSPMPVPFIDDASLYNIIRGQNLYVNCIVFEYIQYVLNWITPQNSSRISTHQFRIGRYSLVSQLTILNVTDEEDTGEYKCVVKSHYNNTESIKRYIQIHDKPIVELGYISFYYKPDEIAEFTCEVMSNPSPKITWSFLKSPLFENSTVVELTDIHTNSTRLVHGFNSMAKMIIQVPGSVTCQACNIFGCNSVTEFIFIRYISETSKPVISPNKEEIVINEGEPLTIACTSLSPIKFIYPNTLKGVQINKTYSIVNEENGTYKLTFHYSNTVYHDTNWYGCADVEITNFYGEPENITNFYDYPELQLIYDNPGVQWIYVYVKSTTNFFVHEDDKKKYNLITGFVHANVGDTKAIPCRPTSPDLVPILRILIKDENKIKDLENRTLFDPRIGFTIRNLTESDNGVYTCLIQKNGVEHLISSKLIMSPLPVPNIDDASLYNVTRGQNLYVNCTVPDLYSKYVLNWVTPQDNSRISTHQFRIIKDWDKFLVSQLTILNVTDEEDTGEYKCVVKSHYNNTESIKRYIQIHGTPIVKSVYLDRIFYEPNQTAKFNCEVISNPSPNITWNFVGSPLLKDSIDVELTDVHTSSTFQLVHGFNSMAKMIIQDPGSVTCQACNIFGCNSATEVIFVHYEDASNFIDIIRPKDLVTKGDDIEITCAASKEYCRKNLKWNTMETNTKISLLETERLQILSHETPSTYRSILKINDVQNSDVHDYICTVQCITDDDDYFTLAKAKYKLIIHDPKSPFFSETNMNETIIKNIAEDNATVILQCFAGGFPKPTVTWYKDNVLLKKNDQFSFKYNYQELNIRDLKEDDSGNYSCRIINRFGTKETYQKIIVKNAQWQNRDIINIPIGVLGISSLILAISVVVIKIRRDKKMKKELMKAGLMDFENGALECLNLELTIDDQVELLPYDKKWEFPKERLKLRKQLGSGAFGIVMKAEAIGIRKGEAITTVAVKMVRKTDPFYTVIALANELKIMVYLGEHLNIVNLFGACTKNIFKRELLVIVEYCHFGNLHNYLLRHRFDFINQIDSTGKLDFTIGKDILRKSINVSSNNSLNVNLGTDSVVHHSPRTGPDSQEISSSSDGHILSNDLSQSGTSNCREDYKNLKPICTQDLLSWAFQVARGMEYLSQRRVLHGDLAARNILLDQDNVVKICDFGLAKNMYKDGNYKKKSNSPLPIKWMAIESIKDRIFSTQSDIWSFGIVLWEFFSLAETPYPGMEAEKQYQKLIEGYRLKQPEYAIREVYDIMMKCWETNPTLRPSFTDLVKSIDNILEENLRSVNNETFDGDETLAKKKY